MFAALGERLRPAAPLLALAETDRLGRKNGRGFYLYEGGREKGVDPVVLDALGESVSRGGDPIDDGAVRERLVLAMVNEAARILEDGIVDTAGELDLAMIMGSGFPPFRGGLLRFADAHHPRSLLEMLETLAADVGARFEPAPTIRRLAEEDRGFYAAFGSGT
jgi:3-hydroxyacyl-CoA dehydrogenase/enoyl-CoA hydratase/3-hydroxybutyryl-CoA epimerase